MPVRRASLTDAADLARLNGVVQQIHHEAQPGQFKAHDLEAATRFFEEQLGRPENVAFLAEPESGRPVGYVAAELLHRPDTALVFGGAVLYVHHIAVEPAEWKRGWGRALMRAIEEEAVRRQIGEVRLDYWTFNNRAQRFFASIGYAPYNVRVAKSLRGGG